MRLLSRILSVALLVMGLIILPLGCSTILLAFKLGMIFDGMYAAFMLFLYIAFSIYETRELIYDWFCPVEIIDSEVHEAEVISNENVSNS